MAGLGEAIIWPAFLLIRTLSHKVAIAIQDEEDLKAALKQAREDIRRERELERTRAERELAEFDRQLRGGGK